MRFIIFKPELNGDFLILEMIGLTYRPYATFTNYNNAEHTCRLLNEDIA